MRIVCPHCNFSKEIDESKVPAGAKRVTCPKCKQKFDLFGADQAKAVPPPVPPPLGPAGPAPTKKSPEADTEPRRPIPPPMPEFKAPLGDQYGRPGLGSESGIPWEDRPGGFFSDLLGTAKMVLFSPFGFFDALPISGGLKGPLIFGVVCGTIGTIFSVIYQVLMSTLGMHFMPMMDPEMAGAVPGLPMTFMYTIMIGVVVLSPLLVAVGLYIGSAIVHLLLMIVRGAGGGFEATFRVLCYSSSTQLFNIIPLVGGFIAGIYSLLLALFGLPRAHDVGVGRVIVALIVLPLLLVVFLGIGMAIMLPMLLGNI